MSIFCHIFFNVSALHEIRHNNNNNNNKPYAGYNLRPLILFRVATKYLRLLGNLKQPRVPMLATYLSRLSDMLST